MPPKPQVFKTPDGKEFSTRAEWRDYMMLTFYSFKNKVDEPEPLVKPPGSVDGQMFDIADCKNSTLVVLDQTEQVQIDVLENCRVFLGACASSIFIRNCKNCVFYTCCRQLRLREVTDCTFYIYSMAEVHIEFSSKLRFAPFNGGYAEQARHLAAASLDVKQNLWYDIYDHNDPGKTHANWSLLPEAEYEQPWFPAGPCEPAIPRTTPGSVKRADADAGMQSFSFQQMVLDAQQTTTAPPSAPASDAAAPPLPEAKTVPVAAPVPPAPPASNGDNDDSVITEIAKLFATLKAGNSLSVSILVWCFTNDNDLLFWFFMFRKLLLRTSVSFFRTVKSRLLPKLKFLLHLKAESSSRWGRSNIRRPRMWPTLDSGQRKVPL